MLDDWERDALARLLAVVLPSDTGPGATEAGAIDYVVARLDREPPELVHAVRSHLAAAAVDPAGTIAALAADPASADYQVFRRIRAWSWEGYLCEPRHRGNRGLVGWTRFGIPRPPQPEGWTLDEMAVVREEAP